MQPPAGTATASGWRTLGILSGLGLVTIFGETMVQPALPNFVKDFQISYDASSWVFSAFLISGAVATPISGKLSDIYGKKRILIAVMSIYCAGVMAAGFATGFAWMIAARVAMGVGFSSFPVAFGLIRETLPPSKLAIGQTVFGATFSAGGVIGLVIGAGLIQAYGWHFAFFAILPVAVALTVIIRFYVKEGSADPPAGIMGGAPTSQTDPTRVSLDFKGIILLGATVVAFLTGISLIQGSAGDFTAEAEIGALVSISVVALILLVFVERRVRFPLIDFKLLTGENALSSTAIILVVGACTYMVYQTISYLVQSPQPLGFGGDKYATAGVLLPFTIVLLLGTIGSGFVLNRLGNARMTAIGTSLSAVGFFGLLAYHSTEFAVSATLAIIAAGLSFGFTGAFNIVLISAPMESTGIVLGMVLLLNLVFQAIGPTVAAGFQQAYQGSVSGLPGLYPTQEAYYLIFLTAAVLSLVSVVLSLLLARKGFTMRTIEQPSAPW